jgi:hypothetical protein
MFSSSNSNSGDFSQKGSFDRRKGKTLSQKGLALFKRDDPFERGFGSFPFCAGAKFLVIFFVCDCFFCCAHQKKKTGQVRTFNPKKNLQRRKESFDIVNLFTFG